VLLLSDAKRNKKVIKQYLTLFAKKHGFKFQNSSTLIKLHGCFLQIVNLTVNATNFHCSYAVQPLYVPASFIGLSYGGRLENQRTYQLWELGHTEESVVLTMLELQTKLEEDVLPWFEETCSIEGTVSFIERNRVVLDSRFISFSPFLRFLYLGFSYLWLHRYQSATAAFEEVLNFFQNDSRPSAMKQCELVLRMIDLIENQPSCIDEILNGFIKETKDNLKLKL
jgi:hypothetical protein